MSVTSPGCTPDPDHRAGRHDRLPGGVQHRGPGARRRGAAPSRSPLVSCSCTTWAPRSPATGRRRRAASRTGRSGTPSGVPTGQGPRRPVTVAVAMSFVTFGSPRARQRGRGGRQLAGELLDLASHVGGGSLSPVGSTKPTAWRSPLRQPAEEGVDAALPARRHPSNRRGHRPPAAPRRGRRQPAGGVRPVGPGVRQGHGAGPSDLGLPCTVVRATPSANVPPGARAAGQRRAAPV